MDNIVYSLCCLLPLIIFIKLAINLNSSSSQHKTNFLLHSLHHQEITHHQSQIIILTALSTQTNILDSPKEISHNQSYKQSDKESTSKGMS
jgi:hypothetical protein